MTGLLTDHAALVTGAGSGIGQASALALAAEGARVCVADIDLAAANATVAAIVAAGGEAYACQANVADAAQVAAMVAQAVRQLGRLDSATNNAGVLALYERVGEISDDSWRRQLDVNLTGVMNCLRAQLPVMVAQGRGSIINLSSGAGLKGLLGAGAYAAAKHGVLGLTRTAALEYAAHNIRVNAICPGFIETPIHAPRIAEGRPRDVKALSPLQRAGRAEEVADAVVWLASERSSFVTGIALPVDGGFAAQ